MPKVAIITEVHNGAKTLAQTIQSVCSQTEDDFIYFIGDDGSTDDTPKLIAQLAAQDSRIVPVYFDSNDMVAHFNALLAQAYNSGAEYLAILDSDDWLEDYFIEYLWQFSKASGADIAMARFVPHSEHGDILDEPLLGFGTDILVTMPQFCEEYASCSSFPTAYQWWGKFYHIPMLRRGAIWAEDYWDIGFSAASYHHCDSIAFCDQVLHHYRCRDDSDSHHRLKTFDAAKETRVQYDLRHQRRSLLSKHGCKNPISWQMTCFQDLREAYFRLYRLLDANMPSHEIGLAIESILTLPFLREDYSVLMDAVNTTKTPFGVSQEKAASLLLEQKTLFLMALRYWRDCQGTMRFTDALSDWNEILNAEM